MNKISSGLLLLVGAGTLAVFWANGYLASWTGQIAGRVSGDGAKTPLGLPAVLRGSARPAPLIRPVPPIGGIA